MSSTETTYSLIRDREKTLSREWIIQNVLPKGGITMANYILLYSGGKMPEPAEQEAVTKDWMAWMGKLGQALVDGGNPFSGQAKTIASNGQVSEGVQGSNASGYSILKADSLIAAVELAKGCPVLKGGAKIMVYETFNAMP
jgi:hypothetical protein